MMTNYCMNPIEVFEIDYPGTPQEDEKSQARMPPSMSQYMIELDLTDKNESEIKI